MGRHDLFDLTIGLLSLQALLLMWTFFSYVRIHQNCKEWTRRQHKVMNQTSLCLNPRMRTKVTFALITISIAIKAAYLEVNE
jgi:hypothetical protein